MTVADHVLFSYSKALKANTIFLLLSIKITYLFEELKRHMSSCFLQDHCKGRDLEIKSVYSTHSLPCSSV